MYFPNDRNNTSRVDFENFCRVDESNMPRAVYTYVYTYVYVYVYV